MSALNMDNYVSFLAGEFNVSKKFAKSFIGSFFNQIVTNADQGYDSKFTVGTFKVKEFPAKEGVNPFTKQPISIPAKTRLSFSPSARTKRVLAAS